LINCIGSTQNAKNKTQDTIQTTSVVNLSVSVKWKEPIYQSETSASFAVIKYELSMKFNEISKYIRYQYTLLFWDDRVFKSRSFPGNLSSD